jgi:hypothetical protein
LGEVHTGRAISTPICAAAAVVTMHTTGGMAMEPAVPKMTND